MSHPGELIIEPKSGQPADACVFILHGLGADGRDFEPLVPALPLKQGLNVRFVLPHAPRLPVTINGGMVMPAWYDIHEMSLDRRVDTHQLVASAERIQELVQEQIGHGIDSRRIILAGFSQGGAVAYQAALSFDAPLGGLLAMSTYYRRHCHALRDQPRAADRGPPRFVRSGGARVAGQGGLPALAGTGLSGALPELPHGACGVSAAGR